MGCLLRVVAAFTQIQRQRTELSRHCVRDLSRRISRLQAIWLMEGVSEYIQRRDGACAGSLVGLKGIEIEGVPSLRSIREVRVNLERTKGADNK